ncbi:hypothetical protein [Loigolactobacillus jiayinensis]|uniref:Polyketide cyclase / dehydrase and lipid transport n=1 Tax=Loigolactobacillus jiayinensis TaxID=2486016 RepID=A0ABW1R9S1_9LACO|nr:hypothetical protein [Loigolactobacillus jiayinensis]
MITKFDNVITICASPERIKFILSNIDNLKQWDLEIAAIIKRSENTATIIRRGPALNDSESVTVGETDRGVIYHSADGTIEYNIDFRIQGEADTSTLNQTVTITKLPNILQIDKLVDLAQVAFKENLQRLKRLCESSKYSQADTMNGRVSK